MATRALRLSGVSLDGRWVTKTLRPSAEQHFRISAAAAGCYAYKNNNRTFASRTAANWNAAAAELPYHLVVGLPALSPTMETGTLAEWYVKEGDSFSAGDGLVKIETDKASIDFEAQDDGYVAKILVEAGTGSDSKLLYSCFACLALLTSCTVCSISSSNPPYLAVDFSTFNYVIPQFPLGHPLW